MTQLIETPIAPQEPEVLLRGRQRRRRRWLFGAIAMVVVTAGVIAAVVILSAMTAVRPHANGAPTATTVPTPPVRHTAAVPQVAWVDEAGRLHLGDLSGFSQRVVAQADADPNAPLVTAGGKVFWVRSQLTSPNGSQLRSPNGSAYPIRTPRCSDSIRQRDEQSRLHLGLRSWLQVDRSYIYVETDYRHLTEYWLDGTPKGRTLSLPDGWYLLNPDLNTDPTPVVANGIVVATWPGPEQNRALGIWSPSTGRVRTLGTVWQVTATYTAPGARSSLVAWNPASCGTSAVCTLKITNTGNYSSRIVVSPIGSFLWGGAFSPDGHQLAVFANSWGHPRRSDGTTGHRKHTVWFAEVGSWRLYLRWGVRPLGTVVARRTALDHWWTYADGINCPGSRCPRRLPDRSSASVPIRCGQESGPRYIERRRAMNTIAPGPTQGMTGDLTLGARVHLTGPVWDKVS